MTLKTWLILFLILVLAVSAAFLVYDRSGHNSQLQTAHRLYEEGDLSGALNALEPFQEENDTGLLLKAHCYRRLGQLENLKQALQSAEVREFDAEAIELVRDLYEVQIGIFEETPVRLERDLVRRGARTNDARSALILGSLAQGQTAEGRRLLERWPSEDPQDAQPLYLAALLARADSEWELTESLLIEAIQTNPRHELAYLSLAEFYSQPPNVDLDKSRLVLQQVRTAFPFNSENAARLARADRELGNLTAARQTLERQPDPDPGSILERAEIALDAGDYQQSTELLRQAEIGSAEQLGKMIDAAFGLSLQGQGSAAEALNRRANWAATALALSGRQAEAERVFEIVLDRVARLRRLADLQIQRGLEPRNQQLTDEINAMVSPAYTPNYPTIEEALRMQPTDEPRANGERLYRAKCQVCHGGTGGGDGRAARHLFPYPRSFRDEPMRYVSARNGLATDGDLINTIRVGLPGTSMPGFPELSDREIDELLQYVRELQRDGLQQRYQQRLSDVAPADATAAEVPKTGKPLEDPAAEAARLAWVQERSVASDPVDVPQLSTASELLPAGAQLFESAGCQRCHSLEQTPPVAKRLFDSLGRPIAARDLRRDAFRGGNSPTAIYKRIVLGIPGTPHPALAEHSAEELEQLVAYVAALSPQEAATETNYRRRVQAQQ